jgi:hypothetical protein
MRNLLILFSEKALRHNGFQLPEVYVNASAGKSAVFT